MNVYIQSIYFQILLTLFIYFRGRKLLPDKKSVQAAFAALLIVEVSLYLFGYVFRKCLPDDVMIDIFYVCCTWYIASIYITFLLLVVELARFVIKKVHIDVAHRQGVRLLSFFCIVVFVSGLMVKAYHNATRPIVVEENLTLPKRNSTRDSLRIVMMSDTHFGEMIGKRSAKRFVELSNAQNPDMVVIVGDLLDYESRFAEKEHIEDDLRGLKAPLGVYIVNGNHEYRANRIAKFRWFEKTGAVHLTDSVVSPDSTFYLVGRDDYVNKNRKPLAAILKDNNHDLPIIALDHQPWSFAEAVMNRVDLGLSGHTHDGQLWPYPWVLKFVYECSHGRYKKGPTQFYVSSGIGFAGPPYRVGTHSELVVLNIKFE